MANIQPDTITVDSYYDINLAEGSKSLVLPIGTDNAREIADDDGAVAVTLLVDKDDFLDAVESRGERDQHDLVHEAAFDFGVPYGSTVDIVGVRGNDFIVQYTTDIISTIDTEDK